VAVALVAVADRDQVRVQPEAWAHGRGIWVCHNGGGAAAEPEAALSMPGHVHVSILR